MSSLAAVIAFAAAPASAAPSAAPPSSAKALPATSVSSELAQAFEASQAVPGSAIGGIRSGTLHTGTAGGHEWAVATFVPRKSVTEQQSVAFQDGASTGVFEKEHGAWQLVRTGSDACGTGVPAALKTAWHITAPASVCGTSAASQRAAAQRALAALPASARSAASAADKSLAKAGTASATVKAATDPADLPQTIAAIALSEVGVDDTPVVTGFNGVDCNPFSTMVAGFSADSDGCGYDTTFNVENENETWCSDFAKWVWEQAGVTSDIDTINAGAVSFYDWATENGQTPEIDTGTPQVGDAVLFFYPGNFPTYADHVGLITSINPDGSIDMVNGDFSGGPDVSAQYDTDITSLSTFGAEVENPGEEWALVSPPTTAQAPAPTGSMTGPSVAVAGTTGHFHASGTVKGSSVDAYYWTFGDSRTTNASGPDVTHAFSEPGTYTVAVTITSAAGTAVTLTQNVHVVAPSGAVTSAPNDGIYYDPLPVDQYSFTRSAGGLAEDSWDGGSWLQLSVPGDPSATGNITTLNYPDAANADNMTPHAFYRSAGGSLAETYQTTSGWVTNDLPGSPVAGGTIVATNTTAVSGDPEVFFLDKSGAVAETWLSGGKWRTAEVLTGGPGISAASLSLADTASGPELFAVGPGGTIRAISDADGTWSERGLPAQTSVGGSLAVMTTPGGAPAVFYTDDGTLDEATQAGATPAGKWDVTTVPGSPAAGTSLAATTYLLPSQIPAEPGDFPNPYGSLTDSNNVEPFGTEAFYMTADGAPAVSYDDGTGWKTETLPSVSGETSIAGVTAFPFEEEPTNLFLTGSGGLAEETTGARSGDPSGGTWTSMFLPTEPAGPTSYIVLYAADPADAALAQAAAAAVGLPADQVTTSYSAAWADTLSGQYLVIAVGAAANAALYYNVCDWSNPSALAGPGTPFSLTDIDLPSSPPATGPVQDLFEFANGATSADTQAWATDLAYYALHSSLPAGVTALPPSGGLPYECLGSPS